MLTDRLTRRDEHQVKWIQAERELIIKGVIIPRSQSTLKSTAVTKGQPARRPRNESDPVPRRLIPLFKLGASSGKCC